MFGYLAKKLFGSANDRIIKSMGQAVHRINELENEAKKYTDEEIKNKTVVFKNRIASGEKLDSILTEAFALVREAASRALNMRHFDVQLIGGMILHQGKIAEMKTGEGKTLVATAPVYLNALSGQGVHVVTVNDYLAKRDSEWMGKVYDFLGLSVDCITNDMGENAKKKAYLADITYGTNNEFGFDYLRDNLRYDPNGMLQRSFNYAIIDEVDSILIDEARTPLIISGPISDNSQIYQSVNNVIQFLTESDLEIDEKSRLVSLTEQGQVSVERILRDLSVIAKESELYDLENMNVIHHLNQSLKAHKLFKRDVDYIIKDNRAMIIDEFTGRIMEGRRYSDGLHQAIEAKEKLKIQSENQTLASITFQNYFRMYPKLAGMTGTAMTEADEFFDIYNLQVLPVPTHAAVSRKDEEDEVYKTSQEKYEAIIKEIKDAHIKGQPVLVGTVSIEKSEHLSDMLKKEKIKHQVLNARYHEQEASIIAQAGQIGAITIATNMAGRGTDITLGGNDKMLSINLDESSLQKLQEKIAQDREKALSYGGLLVIGTERHESRRIDNQLRGRAGRQGDVGRTKFFLSLEDDLMRLFGSEKIGSMLTRLGLKKGEAIVHPWISRSLEKAQQRVEMKNYEVRKNLLRFDDVVNEQRKIIYTQRATIMKKDEFFSMLDEMSQNFSTDIIKKYIPEKAYKEEWDLAIIEKELQEFCDLRIDLQSIDMQNVSDLSDSIYRNFIQLLNHHISVYGKQIFDQVAHGIFLRSLDQLWQDHLHALEHLRGGISLRAYAQKDPLSEYKIEAFKLFQSLQESLDELILGHCLQMHLENEVSFLKNTDSIQSRTESIDGNWVKVSRNADCPCNSGKKFKHCHGGL